MPTKRFKDLDDYELLFAAPTAFSGSTSYYGATDGAANAFVALPDMLADDLLSNSDENLGNELVFSRVALYFS